jgi:hypothetical protein
MLHGSPILSPLFSFTLYLLLKPLDRREYSLMSLENSEFLFSSSLDGVSYSITLPARQQKIMGFSKKMKAGFT